MRNRDVIKCLDFLESMIEKHPENAEMIKAYTRIIEKSIDLEVTYLKGDEELRKDWERNQTERIKSEDALRKASIEKGVNKTKSF
ncbi:MULTISPECIES: hypothetical protein [unclassified Pseudomonas]|uniref:hypothetical protein n=1 Tax=unclassified Pseudomonas TaxID=196821 RepID=UPI0039B7777B